ncbi:hypothetical protein BJ878DRAFT_542041 [Calycina marina]|uniref:Uncharacterized protein n=1 Tax=Calycina marina TaxID=1763456 RepID=A0A9P7Z4D9_9HELO|nr:hypothetical protein BJ878DRAFT_542041 [Calycina marina]
MKAPANATTHLGMNELNFCNSTLYWTNTAAATVKRLAITPEGKAVRNLTVILINWSGNGDLFITGEGKEFVALNSQDQTTALVSGQSQLVTVAGSNTSVSLEGVSALEVSLLRVLEVEKTIRGRRSTLSVNDTVVSFASIAYSVDISGIE